MGMGDKEIGVGASNRKVIHASGTLPARLVHIGDKPFVRVSKQYGASVRLMLTFRVDPANLKADDDLVTVTPSLPVKRGAEDKLVGPDGKGVKWSDAMEELIAWESLNQKAKLYTYAMALGGIVVAKDAAGKVTGTKVRLSAMVNKPCYLVGKDTEQYGFTVDEILPANEGDVPRVDNWVAPWLKKDQAQAAGASEARKTDKSLVDAIIAQSRVIKAHLGEEKAKEFSANTQAERSRLSPGIVNTLDMPYLAAIKLFAWIRGQAVTYKAPMLTLEMGAEWLGDLAGAEAVEDPPAAADEL